MPEPCPKCHDAAALRAAFFTATAGYHADCKSSERLRERWTRLYEAVRDTRAGRGAQQRRVEGGADAGGVWAAKPEE